MAWLKLYKLLCDVATHPANRGRRMRALARSVGWQVFKRLRPSSYLDVRFAGRPVIRCHADSHAASAHIYFAGLPEYASMQFVLRYLRPGDNCIDCGAHIGSYALLMALRVGSSGRVDAFEPNPRLCERLRENIALNGAANVRVHAIALLDHDQGGFLRWTEDGSTGDIVAAPQEGVGGWNVLTACLDSYLGRCRYALAKLDVEGAEPLVLRGAERGIAGRNPPVLLMELDGYSQKYGMTTDELLLWLRQRDYVVGLYEPKERTFNETDRPWEHFRRGERNVIAIAHTKLAEVRQRLAAADCKVTAALSGA